MRFSTGSVAAFVAVLAGCGPAGNVPPQPGPRSVQITGSGILFKDGSESYLGSAAGNFADGMGGNLYTDYVEPGLAFGQGGNWKHDIALQSIAIRFDPMLPSARLARASAYAHIGQTDAALADVTEVIQSAPSQQRTPGMLESAYLVRSLLYARKHLYTLAIADETQMIALDPNNAIGWNARCWHRAIAGELDNALADCNQGLLLSPNSPQILDSRAFVYLKMRNYSAAITGYRVALKRNPKQASSLYGLGLAEKVMGEPGADGDFSAAAKIDPKAAEGFGT